MESLAQLIKQNEHAILNDWLQRQQETIASRRGLIKEEQIKLQATEFLNLFASAFASGEADSPKWKPVHEFLSELSRTRAIQGFSPTETATFVFSLKQPLFQLLRQNRTDAASLADDIWR